MTDELDGCVQHLVIVGDNSVKRKVPFSQSFILECPIDRSSRDDHVNSGFCRRESVL